MIDENPPLYGKAVYYSLWSIIPAISVYDAMLVITNRWTIAQDEQNPIGRWLIAADGGDIRLIVGVKLAGTIVAAAILLLLFWRKRRFAWPACIGVSLLQLWLLIYLSTN